jgi:hypothetical protein
MSVWVLRTIHREGMSRLEMTNQQTLLRYPDESLAHIALKCYGLAQAVLALYMIVYTLIHLIRLPLIPILHRSLSPLSTESWNVVRIPFYWIALQCAAMYGMFSPLEGRALFAHYEKELHGGKGREHAVNRRGNFDAFGAFLDAITELEPKKVMFAAGCFQPFGALNDPLIREESCPAV